MESSCKICGQADHLQYRCNYCNNTFCADHRLPEQHDCPGLRVIEEVDSKWFSDEQNIDPKDAEEVDLPSDVIAEITDTPEFEDQSAAVRNRKTREVIEMLSDSSQVAGGEVMIGEEAGTTPYETIEPGTVGTSIEPEYEGSPDLNPDGSLNTEDGVIEGESQSAGSSNLKGAGKILIFLVFVAVIAILVYIIL